MIGRLCTVELNLHYSELCVEPYAQVATRSIDAGAVLAVVFIGQVFQPESEFRSRTGLPTEQQVNGSPARCAIRIDAGIKDIP